LSSTQQVPSNLRVVVGVTGGIAAYKAVSLVRQLVKDGHTVTVIPTESALKFVGLPTWEAISRNPVPTSIFDGVAEVTHVSLGQSADAVVVAPAGANFLAGYAAGTAADLLGTTLLATHAPVLLAPAMHTEMWEHSATKANIDTLIARGVHIVGPASGALTGDDSGPGRMVEPDEIIDSLYSLLAGNRPLAGKRVLVSAGGTSEPLDPVRFIGNRSSGAMGVAIATEARNRGAEVTLVHGHMDVALPVGVTCLHTPTASAMQAELSAHQPDADIIVMAAAVADYAPTSVSDEKLTKSAGEDTITLTLRKTPDIAKSLGQHKPDGQILVTFSAETEGDDEALIERATRKGVEKNADVMVANRVGWQVGFGETETAVWFIQRSGAPILSTGSKMTVAGRLFDVLQS